MTTIRSQAHASRNPGSEPDKALAVGDEVQAWHNGRLYHQGTITKTVPGLDLIWISDSVTGRPKLLDPEALEIVPASSPRLRDATPTPVTPSAFPFFSHGT